MVYFLYIKTHNKTGLKYLGQTQQNPFVYEGSGTYWIRHIKKYHNNVSTELIAAFDTLDDLKIAGQFWSKKWNVVESKDWANLKAEAGDGGKLSSIAIEKLRQANIGKRFTEDHKVKISFGCKGKGKGKRKPHSDEHKKKLSASVSKGMKKLWLSRQSRYGEESPPCI